MSPSASRELNEGCILVDFYDNHDIWHFFAGCGLFFLFMVSKTGAFLLALFPGSTDQLFFRTSRAWERGYIFIMFVHVHFALVLFQTPLAMQLFIALCIRSSSVIKSWGVESGSEATLHCLLQVSY